MFCGATDLVVDGVVAPLNAGFGLRGDVRRHLGTHRWGKHPAHEGVLEEGRRGEHAPERRAVRVTHGPRRPPRRCARGQLVALALALAVTSACSATSSASWSAPRARRDSMRVEKRAIA